MTNEGAGTSATGAFPATGRASVDIKMEMTSSDPQPMTIASPSPFIARAISARNALARTSG